MRKIVLLLSALAIAGTVSVAAAKPNHIKTSSAHIHATMKGSPSAGACNVGYSSRCPSGTCECFIFGGTVNGNQAGKGEVTINVTEDNGAATANPDGCNPIYADASITGSTDNAQELGIVGAICAGKTARSQPVSGGYGISSSGASLVGDGTFQGTLTHSGAVFDAKLTGFTGPAAP